MHGTLIFAVVDARPLLLFLRPPQAARITQRLGPLGPFAPLGRVQCTAVGAYILVRNFELLLVLFAAVPLAISVQQDCDSRVAPNERG